ncbi:S-Ena type endospore appendage [Evansella halocellulosilytica]|uniref:S-Ena type endospore appendage n=1 Tax=Evansella halocellulosilytica TaxID=2011013 RepID=UPI0015C84DAE|nr:S-Ena type endospore appendage [Evansella halocellulosilytica]
MGEEDIDFSDPYSLLASDEVCGNFTVTCGQTDVIVWNTSDVTSAGTVSIYYGSGCADELIVTVVDSEAIADTFLVPSQNTRSRTYANIVEVRVSCPPGGNQTSCHGRYSIDLHYLV